MEFIEELQQKAKETGTELPEDTAWKLTLHWQLLVEANSKFNLTAIKDQQTAIDKHYLDCLIASKKIRELLPKVKTIADIGSGGGFPGLVMAVANPAGRYTLIESVKKKAEFLRKCALEMGLKNVEVLDIRAEEAGHIKGLRENFDLVTARAVSQLAVLVEYGLPLVRKDGSLIAMKGPKATEEIRQAKQALALIGGEIKAKEQYFLPESNSKYCLVWIKKTRLTDNKYPRRTGIPEKRPLG